MRLVGFFQCFNCCNRCIESITIVHSTTTIQAIVAYNWIPGPQLFRPRGGFWLLIQVTVKKHWFARVAISRGNIKIQNRRDPRKAMDFKSCLWKMLLSPRHRFFQSLFQKSMSFYRLIGKADTPRLFPIDCAALRAVLGESYRPKITRYPLLSFTML